MATVVVVPSPNVSRTNAHTTTNTITNSNPNPNPNPNPNTNTTKNTNTSTSTNMTGRRVPLAEVPNATNSPCRASAATSTKRGRSLAMDQREAVLDQPPPAKRQFVETNDSHARRHALMKRSGNTSTTALQKKLEAARQPRDSTRTREASRLQEQNLESIRQWQEHYRRIFPTFVFYLDSVPDDARGRVLSDLRLLGARVEQFFSKSVTHVVTTRPIPAPNSGSSSELRSPSAHSKTQAGTINPSVLDRLHDVRAGAEAIASRRAAADVLVKAREMGMKIWALEKLQRMMATMFSHNGEPIPHRHNTRNNGGATAGCAQPDLSTLLKQEKLHGPADRDLTVAAPDMTHFRGYYIYVHDMNEQTKPAMVRDYAKTENKQDGQWPQLRATSAGRCPFIDDQSFSRRQKTQKSKDAQRAATAPRTRAATAQQQRPTGESSRAIPERGHGRVLAENNNLATTKDQLGPLLTAPVKHTSLKHMDPPKMIPAKRANPDAPPQTQTQNPPLPPLFGSAQASLRQQPRFAGGEPVASGIQPSNVTSAIKSQMISSTAAAPGARGGTSREVHHLKRKILEKNTSASANSMPSSYINDVRAAINNAPPQRQSKCLAQIEEDQDAEGDKYMVPAAAPKKKKMAERDLKPGYCENCAEKFADFEQHIVSKKHRKFATTTDNWRELDSLLAQLVRV